MDTLRRIAVFLWFAVTALAQHSISERIALPADKTDAQLTLLLPVEAAADAKAVVLPLSSRNKVPLSAQPVITDLVLSGNTLKIHLSDIYFWGEAILAVRMPPGDLYSYTLQRGPSLAPLDVHVGRGRVTDLWLYNFETQPLKIRWRIISGAESVCGLDSEGQPRRDCASPEHWPEVTLGPLRSDPLAFAAADSWFHLRGAFRGESRRVELELRFGTDSAAPLARLPFWLHLDDPFYPTEQFLSHLMRVICWVTLGAAFLMLAQVMIPNFRKCLEMESQVESLQEDLRAIDNVGSRLHSRCQQGINSVRRGLAMRERSARSGRKSKGSSWTRIWSRFALAGNTAEVDRISAILPRIQSRIRLTQRLDEHESGADYPQIPSFCWNRDQQLLAVKEILSGQVVADADEVNASLILDQIANDARSLKGFAEQLDTRVAALQKQFLAESWKTRYAPLVSALSGCTELVNESSGTRSANLAAEQLIFRDTCAVRLEIASLLIAAGLVGNEVSMGILNKLQSISPARLAAARTDLMKISEGISDEDVKAALRTGMWDAFYEPIDPTDQDVIRMSLQFRNKALNRSTAKNEFQCYWHIVADEVGKIEQAKKRKTPKKKGTAGKIIPAPQANHGSAIGSELPVTPVSQVTPAPTETIEKTETGGTTKPSRGYYEEGWETQFILPPGGNEIEPLVEDGSGGKVPLLGDDKTARDPIRIDVGQRATDTVYSRAVRGLIDASITALVPVFTVAFTQFQNGGDLSFTKLVLLGFTSQAIRSAVLPNAGSVSAKPLPAKPNAASSSNSSA